jgi:hypothetical protein
MAENITPSKLRDRIDRGDAGSKVDALDPAAAPLGTDEEAAGTPVSSEAAASALEHEVERSPETTRINRIDSGLTIYFLVIGLFALILIWVLSTLL